MPVMRQGREWVEQMVRAVKLRQARRQFVELDGSDSFRQMAFTFAIIALAAKLARVDGEPTADEFAAFREQFPMPASETDKIRNLFEMAARDDSDGLHHARQIADLFPATKHKDFRISVLRRLLQVALADGALTEGERGLLLRVARTLNVSRWQFSTMAREEALAVGEEDPYTVLGARPEWDDAKIKRAYHGLMRELHPDTMMATGASEDELLRASRKVAVINAAYGAIRRTRSCAA